MGRRSLIAGVIVAVLVAGAWIAMRMANRRFEERLAVLRQENERLRAQAAPGRPEVVAPHETQPARTTPAPTAAPHLPAASAPDEQALARLRTSLDDANADVRRLELRVQELQEQVERLAADNNRLAASQADLNESLSSANRAIETERKELNAKAERLAQVEASTQALRQQAASAAQKSSQISQLSADVQALERRRENFVSSILRRYREITEQYRTFAGAEDRRTPDAPHTGGPDLGRLQNAVSQAEDDLRQLNTLSAQIQALQTKIKRLLES